MDVDRCLGLLYWCSGGCDHYSETPAGIERFQALGKAWRDLKGPKA